MFTYAVYANLIFHSTENQNYSPISNLKKKKKTVTIYGLNQLEKTPMLQKTNHQMQRYSIMTLCLCIILLTKAYIIFNATRIGPFCFCYDGDLLF